MPVDVAALGVDFAALSGHKMLGPSGIGALWGRRDLLDAMPPFLTGGSMITRVTLETAEWNEVPWKFEAGTPAIAEAVGLAAAVEYLESIGMATVRAHERDPVRGGLARARRDRRRSPARPRLDPDEHAGVISFVVDGIHPHDSPTILDRHGVAVRAGHHCAQPVMQRYDLPATTRASFYGLQRPRRRRAPRPMRSARRSASSAPPEMDNLYRDFILEHYREPHNRGVLDPHDLALRRLEPDLWRRAEHDAAAR